MSSEVVEAAPARERLLRAMPLIIFVGAAIISGVRSGEVSLWTDEAVTISAAQRTWTELWSLLATVDAVHGLYYAFMKLWIAAFGTGEFALRLPSALAAGGTAAGALVLARRFTTPGTALTAALLCAVLPRMTWAGIDARPFVFSALVAVWATWALAVAIDRGGAWRWTRYAALAALGVGTNIYLVLLIVGHGITVLVLRRRDRRTRWAFSVAAACTALVVLPLLLLVRSQQEQLGTGIGADRSVGYIMRRIVVNQFFLGETPSAEAAAPWFGAAWQASGVIAALIGAVFALAALLRSARLGDSKREVLAYALPWIALPTVTIAVYAIVAAPIYQPRYFTFTAPAMALLLAFGARTLPRRWFIATITAFALAISVVYVSQRLPYAKSGSDWATAASIIAERAQAGDAVVFEPRFDYPGDVVLLTSRRIAEAYPDPFADLMDLTLRKTGAETGTLDGYSVKLRSIREELGANTTIWVLYGKNHPAEVIADDERVLVAARLAESDRWAGPHTTIVRYDAIQE